MDLKQLFSSRFQVYIYRDAVRDFLVILGLIIPTTVWGLLNGRKWVWWTTAIIFTVNGIGDVIRLTSGGIGGVAGIVIVAGFLF
jgi:hypothetical protein